MQALVLLGEANQGYPEHFFLAIGHLAEASDELVQQYPDQANTIRKERLKLWLDRNYAPPLLDLAMELDALPETPKNASPDEA
jgi:hypothetical protein